MGSNSWCKPHCAKRFLQSPALHSAGCLCHNSPLQNKDGSGCTHDVVGGGGGDGGTLAARRRLEKKGEREHEEREGGEGAGEEE
jgi:hypothetical protein